MNDKLRQLGKELRAAGIESHGHLRLEKDAPEFGESHSLRFRTKNRTVTPDLMELLNSQNVSLTYLGETDAMEFNSEWLIESVN